MEELSKILPFSAGIDIGSEKVFVALPGKPVTSFRTFTASYRELGVYLKENNITHVAMEATGVYWITLFDILEELGFDVTLVNPADSKNLPGRKTDVQDCQWIQQLFSYGLLRKSFVPEDIIRKLRVFARMRDDKLEMAGSHIRHMQKALIQMNIRLPEVLSQVHGVSGMKMIKAILSGERNSNNLLQHCTQELIKRKGADILLALEGNYKEEYLFELQQAHDGYFFYLKQVEECDIQIGEILHEFANKTGNKYEDDNLIKAIRHNKPNIKNLHQLLLDIHNANPTTLPGLTDYNLMKLTAELGNNIQQWPNVKCFVSWLGLAPGKNQSGKMNKRSRKRKNTTRAGQIFKEAAQTIMLSKKIGLGVFARKLKSRRGPAIAIKATARKLAQLYYNIFDKGLAYVEKGIELYEQQTKIRELKYLKRKALENNLILIPNTL